MNPIADYALISDCHSAALVGRDGSIDWLCLPRFDSPSVFARLLDHRAGSWSVRPADPETVSRRYRRGGMVLEATFQCGSGVMTLTDAMAAGPNEQGHGLARHAPRVLLRHVRCTEGRVEVETAYAPRPEYGLVTPRLRTLGGGVAARGGSDVLVLSVPGPVEIRDAVARGRWSLSAGDEVALSLGHANSWEPRPAPLEPGEIVRLLDETTDAWQSWSSAHQNYEGPWEDLVYRSGCVLQALTFVPTGAIVAAPTTSLPETVGGMRNWDYRYAWVRDASFTLQALWVAACPDEAREFFGWMAGAAAQVSAEADLQIMFGVGGERDLTERELPHLTGWRDSRPVRIGNGAWAQRQLDVYGELLDAAHRLADQLGDLDADTRSFLAEAADAAAARWTEPDQGIWEVRGGPRHFLYSKLMCWVALDRALALASAIGAEDRVERWTAAGEEIRGAILEQGWSDAAGSFTQSFGSNALDASALVLPIARFLPADDLRVRSTIDAVAERLTDGRGLVYRYRTDDGLEGEEGTFLLCTFWLAQAQAMAGQVERATETFERAAAFANDVGLLSEEVDPASGELLGNFPQAFSHIGLVNAAWAITEARARAGGS